ncbi:uncharacterized protein [Pseudorasbora parva]|uniref:uncharacterized protein isoform X1 n=1 Tax=Pseudorasbora parva TaxID=51549 RepID=UPI00351E74FE
MPFIKEESEDIKIENVFSLKQEETEEQTKKEESEDLKIEYVFSLKHEEAEEQTETIAQRDSTVPSSLSFPQPLRASMPKPQFRPCPNCQVRQQANRKTCNACFAMLPSKRLLKTAHINDDWAQKITRNKNASRVVASAQMDVLKLSALGYMPILFICKKHKGTGKFVADVVTHLPPTQTNTWFLTSMKKAYDFIIKLGDVPPPQQDQFLPQQDQFLPQQDPFLPQQDPFLPQQDQFLPQQDQFLPQQDQFLPQKDQPLFQKDQPLLQKDQPLFQQDQFLPQKDQPLFQKDQPLHQKDQPLPQQDQFLPQKDQPLFQKDQPLHQKDQPLPQQDQFLPQKDQPLPQQDLPSPNKTSPSQKTSKLSH